MLPSPEHLAQRDLAELRWATALAGEVISAILEVWQDQDSVRARVRADWIWDNLHWDLSAIRDLHPQFLTRQDGGATFAAEVGQFFSTGGLLPSERPSTDTPDSPRRAFFGWLWRRKIQPNLTANPELLTLVAKELTDHAEEMVTMLRQNGFPERAAAVHVYHALSDLPAELRHEVQPPPTLARVLGLSPSNPMIETGGQEFLPADFWQAMTVAVNGGNKTITSLAGQRFVFSAGEREAFGHAALMGQENSDRTQIVMGRWLPLLLESEDRRRDYLNTQPTLFDLPAEDRKSSVTEIATAFSGSDRIQLAEVQERRSGAAFFQHLETRLRSGERPEFDDFLPTALSALPLHLRISTTADPDFALAAERLLAEVGLEESLVRMSGIPFRLPDPLIAAALELDSGPFGRILSLLRKRCLTPTSRLALFEVATQRARMDSACVALAVEIRNGLLDASTGRDGFEGFALILRWTIERFRLSPGVGEWNTSVFLACAWMHASRLHNVLLGLGVQHSDVREHFIHALARLPRFVRSPRAAVINDAAGQFDVPWCVLLARGLGSAIAALPTDFASQFQIEIEQLLNAREEHENEKLLHLTAETATRPNALASFLGGAWATPLRALLGEMGFSKVFESSAESIARTHLDILETNPLALDAWIVLWAVTGSAPFLTEGWDRLKSLMLGADFVQFFRREPVKSGVALNFACAQARNLGDVQLCRRLKDQLLVCARFSGDGHERGIGELADPGIFEGATWKLVEAAYWLSVDEADSDTEFTFSSLALELTRACPEIGTSLRKRLGMRPGALPLRLAAGAWPLYLAIRASHPTASTDLTDG